MIRAKFLVEQNQSLEKIHELTQIPLEKLESYHQGNSPIPLDHLLQISHVLELRPEIFLCSEKMQKETDKTIPDQEQSPPEFTEDERQEPIQAEDPMIHIFNAFKLIPIEDQADIAKTLLDKLKTK